ncbi:hypothetical protein RYX36_012631, partial [Vicia faba]
IPHIGQTKVGELAKSFLWEPFFPVHLNDTILHALLLLSKHRLQVLPDAAPIGFVTQVSVELSIEEAYVCIFLKMYRFGMSIVFAFMLECSSPTTSSIKRT